jgi:toxin ParE1/3/4
MSLKVLLTEDALRDLGDLYTYIAENDSQANAERVLDRIEEVFERLADHPLRGSCPKELLALGMRDYRQLFFKPYRVIYRVAGQRVYVYVVADGRHDMQTLLARRLLAD